MTEVSYQLEAVRNPDWYRALLSTLPDAEVLLDVFGPRGLGYLVLVGVRIDSVAYDPNDGPGSVVDSMLPDGRIARASARVLVRRSVEALVEQIGLAGPLPITGTADELRQCLGMRFILASALHDVTLESLVVEDGVPSIVVRVQGTTAKLTLAEAREQLASALVQDLDGLEGVRLDDEFVSSLRALEEGGDADRIIAALEPHVGSVVSALRGGSAVRMDGEERARLVFVISALGRAYASRGDAESAETIVRMGAQGCKGEPESATLFLQLAALAAARGEPGEAIGLYRRAEALGAGDELVVPGLAAALHARGRSVAAALLLDRLRRRGPLEGDAAELDAKLREVLGEPLERALRERRLAV